MQQALSSCFSLIFTVVEFMGNKLIEFSIIRNTKPLRAVPRKTEVTYQLKPLQIIFKHAQARHLRSF